MIEKQELIYNPKKLKNTQMILCKEKKISRNREKKISLSKYKKK